MGNDQVIRLAHGSGGLLSYRLIRDVFQKHIHSKEIAKMDDAATIVSDTNDEILISTDSFVIDPIFFPGGNIGSLAVCGTVNDIAVSGGIPKYLTASFILEEGFSIHDLERIASSMGTEARDAGVQIITGDTKVVEKGKGDKIFINTTGIGWKHPEAHLGMDLIQPGDHIIINGYIADHGVAILSQREGLKFSSQIHSDARCLHHTIMKLIASYPGIRFMRDPTRGGVATVLSEIAQDSGKSLTIYEEKVPIRTETAGACDILGIDPLYLANEGKFILICSPGQSKTIIDAIRHDQIGSEPAVIGYVTDEGPHAWMKTRYGGTRILEMLPDEILPRIC